MLSGCVNIPFRNDMFQPKARTAFIKTINLTTDGVYTGSGVVVDHIDNLYSIIITAGHICKENTLQMAVLDYMEKDYGVLYVAKSQEDDLCAIITTEKIPVTAVSVANFPINIGDKIYNVAAPMGIHSKNMSLMFEGYYSGNMPNRNDKYMLSVYTLPTVGGSSGSPIFNQNWELIGIMSRAYPGFENVGLSVSHERVDLFVRVVKQTSRNTLKVRLSDKFNRLLLKFCQETNFCRT